MKRNIVFVLLAVLMTVVWTMSALATIMPDEDCREDGHILCL